MNKGEFLNELEKRIRVLAKNEIKDILVEYSQHIDMKMESGLIEAEAIKDFGNMDDLAAEILEAYHVNPAYEKETETPKLLPEVEKKSGYASFVGFFMLIGRGIKRVFAAIVRGLSSVGRHIKKLFVAMILFIKNSLKPKENSEITGTVIATAGMEGKDNQEKTENKSVKKAEGTRTAGKVKGRCKKVIRGFLFACLAVFVVLCLIPTTIVGLLSIFGVGVSIVLLVQGYPVAGILIGCIGLAVMSISFWLLMVSLLIRKKKEENWAKLDEGTEAIEKDIIEGSVEEDKQ